LLPQPELEMHRGLPISIRWSNQVNLYGNSLMSFLLEILKVVIIVGKNKYGYQLGVKYYNAFHIDNLLLQLEYVRPCIRMPITNYGHNNQSMGHQWVAILRNLCNCPLSSRKIL
jgi:hypothetical protein